jgi:hypothetical protein
MLFERGADLFRKDQVERSPHIPLFPPSLPPSLFETDISFSLHSGVDPLSKFFLSGRKKGAVIF